MRPLPNASGGSALDRARPWADQVLQKRGVLHQEPAVRAEAVCLKVVGRTLILVPLAKAGRPPLATGRRAVFEVLDPSSLTHISGHLEGPQDVEIRGVLHEVWRLDVDLGSVRWVNRRAFYRVSVRLKGEMAVVAPAEVPGVEAGSQGQAGRQHSHLQLQELAQSVVSRRQPVIVRDLSVGGARLSVGSPPPDAGENALLDLTLDRTDVLRNLLCTVVEGYSGVDSSPLDALVRIRFVSLPPRLENELSRYVATLQREMLQKGVRP